MTVVSALLSFYNETTVPGQKVTRVYVKESGSVNFAVLCCILPCLKTMRPSSSVISVGISHMVDSVFEV